MSSEKEQSRRQSHPRLRVALAAILAVVLICAAAFAVSVNIYYHAEPAAVQAMASDSAVSVYELRDGVTIFAPEEPSAGFIFYPGGKVEHTAYAPLLRACAERGVLCVLIRMPCNLTVFHLNGASGIPEQFPDVEHFELLASSQNTLSILPCPVLIERPGNAPVTFCGVRTALFDSATYILCLFTTQPIGNAKRFPPLAGENHRFRAGSVFEHSRLSGNPEACLPQVQLLKRMAAPRSGQRMR